MGYSDLFKITSNKTYTPLPVVKDQKKNRNGNNYAPKNIFAEPLREDIFEKKPKPYKRINDIDSKIMNKNLIKYLPTDSLRLELLLENGEKELQDTLNEINAQKVLEPGKNSEKLQELNDKKLLIEKQIKAYKEQYRDLGFVYQIADFFSENYQFLKENARNLKDAFVQNTLVQILAGFLPDFKQKALVSSIIEKFNAVESKTVKIFDQKSRPYGEEDNYTREYEDIAFKSTLLEFQSKRILMPKEESRKADLKTTAKEHFEVLKQKLLFFVSVFVDINVPKN